MGENKHVRLVIEVGVVASLITLVMIYHEFVAGMSTKDLLIFSFFAIVVMLLVAASVSWVYSQPQQLLDGVKTSLAELKKEGTRLHWELKTTLTETLERQPYVSEDMLAMIEEQADSIWVVTTDLKNDVTPGRIRDSVAKNLEKGKNYTYFIPSPTDPNFPNAAQYERAYKNWSVYKERNAQIRFIHLPNDTLFLFREVVIYNPLIDTNAEFEKAARGFTYFDTAADSQDRLMKIPDTYLQFLKGQLHRYAEDVGLITELQRLIQELRRRLEPTEIVYLANLIGERRIEGFGEFRSFIEGVRKRDPLAADILSKTLERYTERAA